MGRGHCERERGGLVDTLPCLSSHTHTHITDKEQVYPLLHQSHAGIKPTDV